MLKNCILKISKMVLVTFVTLIIFIIFFICSYINGMKYHPNYNLADELLVQDKHYSFANIMSMKNLLSIPRNHLEILRDAGYKIEINKEKIISYSKEYYRFFAGLTVYADKRIYLYPVTDQVGANLLHEVAHALSKINGDPDESEIFENIYKKEKSKIREYAQKDSSEFFADVYMLQFNDFWFNYKKEDFPLSQKYLESLDWWDTNKVS